MPGMNHGSMPGMPMNHGSMAGMEASPEAKKLEGSVGVDNVAMMPTERLNRAGEGFPPGRRVLTYADLRATRPGSDPRPPSRDITLHLTGNMERFIWGFDGKKFSEAEPIVLQRGERVRFVLINDSMMEHPIHLHGLWSELENGHDAYRPYKHTINVKPAADHAANALLGHEVEGAVGAALDRLPAFDRQPFRRRHQGDLL
jgi:FtsP/CotA-like multicopper oxidase with cupredoxin domain